MAELDLDGLLGAAVAAAHAGGEIVRAAFGSAGGVVEKGPGDYVSETDTASERAVRAVLEAAAPALPVFGEEEGGERAAAGWLVDPLDGTANFLHGFPVVGVSVGLVVEGRPVAGVVHAPMLGDTFTARDGGGAFHNGTPIRVSTRPPEQGISATGFPFRKKRERLGEYQPVFERAL
ncbi:MAG TPA: inositol monophosphatase family protein, partial [Acidimicrobiia bacterium]|nr:inositol monophosphatase family protein [Acidimicrobiia bacterium]